MSLGIPPRASLQRLAAPAVAEAIKALGSTVTVYRAPGARDATNRTRRKGTWAVLKAGVACELSVDRLEEAQRVFGMDTAVTVVGAVSTYAVRPLAALPAELEAFAYGVAVTRGFLAGRRFLVEGAVPDDVPQTLALGLVGTEEAFA